MNDKAKIEGSRKNHLIREANPKGRKPFQMPAYLQAKRELEEEYSDKSLEKLMVDTKRQGVLSIHTLIKNGDTRPDVLKIGCSLGTPDIPQDDTRNWRVFIEKIFILMNQQAIESNSPIEIEVIRDGKETV